MPLFFGAYYGVLHHVSRRSVRNDRQVPGSRRTLIRGNDHASQDVICFWRDGHASSSSYDHLVEAFPALIDVDTFDNTVTLFITSWTLSCLRNWLSTITNSPCIDILIPVPFALSLCCLLALFPSFSTQNSPIRLLSISLVDMSVHHVIVIHQPVQMFFFRWKGAGQSLTWFGVVCWWVSGGVEAVRIVFFICVCVGVFIFFCIFVVIVVRIVGLILKVRWALWSKRRYETLSF